MMLSGTWVKKVLVLVMLAVVIGLVMIIARWKKAKNLDKHWLFREEQIKETCKSTVYSETIFVSVASYRDPECARTLFDLFEKAACPHRVFVGCCVQNHDRDSEVLFDYNRLLKQFKTLQSFQNQIRFLNMDAEDAKGPMLARHLIEQKLFRQEEFYLIIDSHTQLVPGWDQLLIKMWHQCRNPRAILTMYPDDFDVWQDFPYEPVDFNDLPPPSYLRVRGWDSNLGIPLLESYECKKPLTEPCQSLFYAPGFAFSSSVRIQQVPYDSLCSYVFTGEDFAMAIRLWTSGFDFYVPTRMVAQHMWTRRRPVFWEQLAESEPDAVSRRQEEAMGYRRVRALLGLGGLQPLDPLVLNPYGLGQVRTWYQFQQFTGCWFHYQRTELHGLMGTSPSANNEEIVSKFGGIGSYHVEQQNILSLNKQ